MPQHDVPGGIGLPPRRPIKRPKRRAAARPTRAVAKKFDLPERDPQMWRAIQARIAQVRAEGDAPRAPAVTPRRVHTAQTYVPTVSNISPIPEEPLPSGAMGRDKHGRAYYGEGISGWWRGVGARIGAPVDKPEGPLVVTHETETTIFGAQQRIAEPQLGTIWDTLKNLGDTGEGPGPLSLAVRVVGEALTGVGELAGRSAELTRQTFGGIRALEEAGEGSPIPHFPFPERGSLPTWYVEYIKTLHPLAIAGNMLRTLTSPKTLDEKSEDVRKGWNAGRILFTGWADPAIRHEYMRRYEAGENPYLLAMELENPTAELIGMLIFDPLNLLGIPMRRARDIRRISSIKDEFLRLIPDVEKALGKADIATDAVAARQFGRAVEAQMDYVKIVKGALDKWSNDHGIMSLTNMGKQYILARRSSELARWVAANADDIDEAIDMYTAMARMTSSNPNVVDAAMQTLMSFKAPRPLMSRAGTELGLVTRRMIGDIDDIRDSQRFLKQIEEARMAANPIDAMAEMMNNKIAAVTKDLFPSVIEKLGMTEAQLAARGFAKVPLPVRALARFHVAAQKGPGGFGYRLMNSFFAGIYMGLSPGYAFRNAFNNTFTAFVDIGPAILKQWRPGNAAEKTHRLWLKTVPEGAREGIGAVGAVEITDWSRKLPGTVVADKVEKINAMQITATVVEKAMRDMLRPGRGLPDFAPLLDAGLPKPVAAELYRLVVNNYGDVKAGMAQFRKMYSTGSVDTFRNLSWVAAADEKALRGFRIYDEALAAMVDAPDVTTAAQRMEKVFLELIAEGKKVVGDMPTVSKTSEGVQSIHILSEATHSGHVTREALGHATNAIEASAQSNAAWTQVVADKYREAIARVPRTGKGAAEINKVLDKPLTKAGIKFRDVMDGTHLDRAQKASEGFTASAWAWSDKIKKTKTGDWAQMWREIGMAGEPPVGLNKKQLLDAFWDTHYRQWQQTWWSLYRDGLAQVGEEAIEALAKVSKVALDDTPIQQARWLTNRARKWDDFLADRDISKAAEVALKRGDNASAIRAYANQFNPQMNKLGLKPLTNDKHILNVINKHNAEGKTFAKLADVPPEVGRNTLREYVLSKGDEIGIRPGDAAKAVTNEEKAARVLAREAGTGGVWSRERLNKAGIGDEVIDDLLDRGVFAEGVFDGQPTIHIEGLADDIRRAKTRLVATEVTPDMIPYSGGPPTLQRVIFESEAKLTDLSRRMVQGVKDNWGKTQPVVVNRQVEKALSVWMKAAEGGVAESRLIAARLGDAARDFALHSYAGKRNLDIGAAYIFPYQFWHSRTMGKWLQRVAMNPEVISAYAKYKETLAKIHADMPEWWRYQINTNELLGLDSDNPLFFNLEATLNPVYGMTGVDFRDRRKRINWFTSFLDELGQHGPSVWTPYAIATAIVLKRMGEEEAAARWGGRLGSQTATIRSMTSGILGLPGVPGGIEIDPLVHLFSGGIDAYTQSRIGRALAAMVEEGLVSPTGAIEAGRRRAGDIWEQARDREGKQYAPGQLFSFFFGPGFRMRTLSDMMIDRFDDEWGRLQAGKHNMSPDEYRDGIEYLKGKYPFADTILLSRQGTDARDSSYSYNVLSRVPPGEKNEFMRAVGVPDQLVRQFYDNKGDLSVFSASDRERFLRGISDLGSMLELPDYPTRREWRAASKKFSEMNRLIERQFGKDMDDRMGLYFIKKAENFEDAEKYLEDNPDVAAAMDFRTKYIHSFDITSAYYGSVRAIEQWYRSRMWAEVEQRFGKEIWDIQTEYFDLLDRKERRAFLEEHPELKEYWDTRDVFRKQAAAAMTDAVTRLPEGKPAGIQERFVPESIGQEEVLQMIQQPGDQGVYDFTWVDWQEHLSRPLQNVVLDLILMDEELPDAAQAGLDRVASQLGIETELMMELIERSLSTAPEFIDR